jgi:transposase-like protein
MAKYSPECKEAILKKMLPPLNMTVAELSREEGISEGTLYNWRDQLKREGHSVPGKKSTSDKWSAQAKFAAVVATASMPAAQVSQYCREKGLYVEQLERWKQDCLNGFEASDAQEKKLQYRSKQDKARIKELERDLRHKEKALAETAALLVLRKKLDALLGDDHEDK